MNLHNVIELAEQFVKKELAQDSSGHDWWHIHRVRKLAVRMAKQEGADVFVCELAALLHDVADEKLNISKEAGLIKVRRWLENHVDDLRTIDRVLHIITNMSYRGGTNPPLESLEGQVVQDADRLDAIGAIGIARTFAFAGWKGHRMYEPGTEGTAIDHFHEKLLKLKDLMNTAYAKKLAEQRHEWLEAYLRQFYMEWEGAD